MGRQRESGKGNRNYEFTEDLSLATGQAKLPCECMDTEVCTFLLTGVGSSLGRPPACPVAFEIPSGQSHLPSGNTTLILR